MKKTVSIILLVLALCLAGCKIGNFAQSKKEMKGVWVTQNEFINTVLETGSISAAAEKIVSFVKDMGGNAVFLQVRANADSIYKSKYFPLCDALKDKDEDALKVFKEICERYEVKFHAWVNPYRISSKQDTDTSFFKDLNWDIVTGSFGTYFNPASDKVRKLVLDGIREILNYGVDGIHFDDYFYPTTDEDFDKTSYKEYCEKSLKPLSLKEYRTANVTLLVSEVKNAVKRKDKNIVFTVSPSADIKKNRDKLYADIKGWCKEGYIDAVIPQIYFGFDYPDEEFSFEKLTLKWINEVKDTDVELIIGLAPYKLNTKSKYDKEEWANGYDIVARQIRYTKNIERANGNLLFSYSYLNSENEDIKKQKETIEAEWKNKNE